MSTCISITVKNIVFSLISSVFYQDILILGDSVLLGRFKLGDEDFDVYDSDAKFTEFRSDGDFIFY